MMKKLTLLLLMLVYSASYSFAQGVLFSKPKNDLFEVQDIKVISAKHKKLAILPFKTLITYQNPNLNASSQLEQVKNQQMLSYMWQVALYNRFTKNAKNLSVEILDIQETNKILVANDYMRNFKKFTPQDLCRMLNVDAIVFSTYDLSLNNNDKPLILVGLQHAANLGLEAVAGDIKGLNPKMIQELISDPGEFVNKLKSGDIEQLISLTADAIGLDKNVQKTLTIVANNSGTLVKLSRGETDGLLQDILVNNASLIGDQIGGNNGKIVSDLIRKNGTTIQKIIDGDTEDLFTDLVANNLSVVAEQFAGANGPVLSSVLKNNSETLKSLLKGDTNGLFEQLIANNASLIGDKIGGPNAQLYTNLIVNNKDLIKDISSGNTSSLFQNIITNNIASVGQQFGSEDIAKYTQLISENKNTIQDLIKGDLSEVKNRLMQEGTTLLGTQLQGTELEKFSNLLTSNKELVQGFASGNTGGLLDIALKQNSGLLGTNLDVGQIQQFTSLVGGNKDLIQNLVSGNANDILGGAFSKLAGDKFNVEQSKKISSLLTENTDLLSAVVSGEIGDVSSKLKGLMSAASAEEVGKYAEFLSNNKGDITQLFNVDVTALNQAKDFMNPDMIAGLSTAFGNDGNFIGAILNGDNKVMVDQMLRSDALSNLGIDNGVLSSMADLFLSKKEDVAQVIAGGSVDFFAATGELNQENFSIQVEDESAVDDDKKKSKVVIKKKNFFNKATDLYLTGSANKTNTSEKISNFISGSKGDISRFSLSIFNGENNGLTWNYVGLQENTNVYNMEKTLDDFAGKFYKKLPYVK